MSPGSERGAALFPAHATNVNALRPVLLWVLALGVAGCCSAPRARTAPAPEASSPPEPYVRVADIESNLVQLQIAARKFYPARREGPVLWLVGVSHVGSPRYYATLQKLLDAQTLVLFEGVSSSPETGSFHAPPPQARPARVDSSLQGAMASALGLVFQLDAIDYDRTNFQNCDLSVQQLRALIAQQPTPAGESGAGASFDNLLQLMQGGTLLDSLVHLGLSFIGANPKLQGVAKLALIDCICAIQGDPSRLEGLPPDMKQLLDVLLQQRNQNILTRLRTELRCLGPQQSVAVFYGTGHMPDLEGRIRSDFHYQPAGERWFTAFSVDLARAGITPPEREFMERLIKSQLGGGEK